MRMPLEGGPARQLSEEVVESGAISPDGQQIAMLTVQGNGVQIRPVIKVIPADGGAPIKTVDSHPLISGLMQFSGDGKSILYPVTEKGVSNLVKQSLDGGAPVPVTNFTDWSCTDTPTTGQTRNWRDPGEVEFRYRIDQAATSSAIKGFKFECPAPLVVRTGGIFSGHRRNGCFVSRADGRWATKNGFARSAGRGGR